MLATKFPEYPELIEVVLSIDREGPGFNNQPVASYPQRATVKPSGNRR